MFFSFLPNGETDKGWFVRLWSKKYVRFWKLQLSPKPKACNKPEALSKLKGYEQASKTFNAKIEMYWGEEAMKCCLLPARLFAIYDTLILEKQ